MYYEDLGLFFHDKSFFNVENPVTRDELWKNHDETGDDGWGTQTAYFVCIEFNVEGLTSGKIADLEYELSAAFAGAEYFAYDDGGREIGGLAGYDTYADILSILRAYDVTDTNDRTTCA